VEHFGDQNDTGAECDICDFCAPLQDEGLGPTRSQSISAGDQIIVAALLASLEGQDHPAAGRLFSEMMELYPRLERRDFEGILKGLAQARWICIQETSFQKGGETIAYRKVSLTEQGRNVTSQDIQQLKMRGSLSGAAQSGMISKKQSSRTKLKKSANSRGFKPRQSTDPEELSVEFTVLFETLRTWRLELARKRGIPAFRILSDRVLKLICVEKPKDTDSIRTVKGIGPKLADLYAGDIIQIVKNSS
jgi:DNA topoisomerase-3